MPNQSSPHARQQHRAGTQTKQERCNELEAIIKPLVAEYEGLMEEIYAEPEVDPQAAEGSQAGEQAEPGAEGANSAESEPEATTEPDSDGSEPSESDDQTEPVSAGSEVT